MPVLGHDFWDGISGSNQFAFSAGTIDHVARAEGYSVSALNLKVVFPFAPQLKEIFKQFKQVASVELAYGDEKRPSPFTMLLRSETLVDVQAAVTQTTGRPIKPLEVLARIKEILS